MSNTEAVLAVSALLGYVITWLRGFPKFNDGETIALCGVAGIVAAFLSVTPVVAKPLLETAIQNTLTILGGVMAGHIVATGTDGKVAGLPKFNQFSGPPKP